MYSQEGEHLSETTLSQFLRGTLAGEDTFHVEGHLAACVQCRTRLDEIVREGGIANASRIALVQAFARKGLAPPASELAPIPQHAPDFNTIAAYVDGTLPPEQTKTFETWMQQRPRLAEEVRTLRALQDELQSPVSLHQTSTVASSTPNAESLMVVHRAGGSAATTRAWWATWRWPVRSFGFAIPVALLLLAVVNLQPWRPKSQTLQGQFIPPSGASRKTPQPKISHQRGDNSDQGPNYSPVQTRLLTLASSRRDSQALLSLVSIQPYKVKGSFDHKGAWHRSPSPDAYTSLGFSRPLEFQVGDGAQFRLTNQSKQSLYVVLLWLAQDGTITPITRPKPQTWPVIKLASQGTSGAYVATDDYAIASPADDENIVIFVSTKPINAKYLRFNGTGSSASQETRNLSSLDMALAQVSGMPIPSKSFTSITSKTWTATTFRIHSRER